MIKEITASARISFKQPTKTGDVFYTFEYGETHSIDDSKFDEDNNLYLAVKPFLHNKSYL